MVSLTDATVLHVDDDYANRESLGWILRAEGFRVVEAGTGADALRLALLKMPDLVVLDVRLPDMSGFEVCRRIKADPTTSSIPVLQLSGHFVEPTDRVQGLETGADAYLLKPVDPRELVAHLRALLRVHRAERMQRAILETAPDAVLVLAADGTIHQSNSATERLFGYSARQLAGVCVTDLLPGPASTGLGDVPWLLRGEPGRRGIPTAVTARRKDGSSFPAEFTVGIMQMDPAPMYAAFIHDLTERNRLEEQLRQAVKMEAIGRLAGGVAHDFNNQLTVINGYVDLLLASMSADDPAREYLGEIRRSGDHAAALTRQLLAFSRKQRLNPQVLNLNTVLGELVKMLRRLLGADIELVMDLEPGLRPIRADAGQIEQVLMNLAVNARDAMPAGGRLQIRTRNAEPDSAVADQHPEMPAGPHVVLEVSDTGVGMTEEVRARVFEPFFTTKDVGKGTGLGLATVYAIVKASNGHIDIESTPGHGATFRIHLPRVTDSALFERSAVDSFRIPRGSETVLLVEDEAGVRSLAGVILRSCGYEVLEAADGQQALHLCQEHASTIHLLVSDVVMPRMNGPRLADDLRQMRPALRVLFVSGYTDEGTLPHGTQIPGHFLQKPFTPASLAGKVRQVLDEPL
jgi:PAS domain S-box-containing protein